MLIETLEELKEEGLLEYLSDIPECRQKAFRLRYGLSGKPPMSFESIGEEFGFSRTQARNYTLDAIEKLRKAKLDAAQRKIEQEKEEKLNVRVKENSMVLDANSISIAIKVLEQYPNIVTTAELKELLCVKLQNKGNLKEMVLNMPVDIFGASVRTLNCLANQRPRVETIGQLAQLFPDSLLRTRNFGQKSYREVVSILKSCNLGLGMTLKDAIENLIITAALYNDIRGSFKVRSKYLTHTEEENATKGLMAMAELLKEEVNNE